MSRLTFLLAVFLVLAVASKGTVLAGKGGPDAGGYTYIDSNEVGAPGPEFFNISGGTDIGSSCDDCVVSGVPIGFSFVFYGTTYTMMNISSNGNIQFTTASTVLFDSLPTNNLGPAIVPFLDDLMTNCTSVDAIFKETRGQAPARATIVQWRMTPHFRCVPLGGTQQGEITFQAILFEGTNDILFLYPDTFFATAPTPGSANNNGANAAVGIQRDGSTGLAYSNHSPIITSGLAICFHGPTPPNSRVPSPAYCGGGVYTPGQPTTQPNIGAAIGAIVAGADGTRDNLARQAQVQAGAQQNAAAAAAAVQQAAQPSGLLRPPNTGDAGLLEQDNESYHRLAVIAAIALTLASLGFAWGQVRARGGY